MRQQRTRTPKQKFTTKNKVSCWHCGKQGGVFIVKRIEAKPRFVCKEGCK